jgi:hypothetical protein
MDHGADRYPQPDVVRSSTVLVGPAAVLAVSRFMTAGKAVVNQGIDVPVSYGIDAAAFAAITAVRATEWPEFFATKRCNAVAAIAGDNFNFCFVNELHVGLPKSKKALPAAEPFCRDVARALRRNDRHKLTLGWTFDSKLNLARDQCKQGVVFAHTDIFARMCLSTTLTNDDTAGINSLTAVNFDAKSF